MFQSVNSSLRGVGGWLLFFIIGAGILRPLYYVGNTLESDRHAIDILQSRFPRTVTLLYGEIVANVALVILGIAVALMLWRIHKPISVTLAKIFLIANAVLPILDILLVHFYTDLPPQVVSDVESRVIIQTIATVIISLLWFSYFLKSERVRATYFSDSYQY